MPVTVVSVFAIALGPVADKFSLGSGSEDVTFLPGLPAVAGGWSGSDLSVSETMPQFSGSANRTECSRDVLPRKLDFEPSRGQVVCQGCR